MKKSATVDCVNARRVLIFSVLLNLALAGWVVHAWGRPRGDVENISQERGPTVSRLRGATPSSSVGAEAAWGAYLGQNFRWSQIETNDLVQLALNMRGVGCPEETVREVVSARAIRALGQSVRAARPRQPFWTAGGSRERAIREAEALAAAARDKIRASVEEALGAGNFLENPKWTRDLVDQALMRFFTGPMSEKSFSQVQIVFTRQEAREEEIRALAHGVMLADDEAAMERLNQHFKKEIEAVLAPAELEEFLARAGAMRQSGGEIRFDATDFTPAEVREIGLARGQLGFGKLSRWTESFDLSAEQEAQLAADLSRRFGAARYAQIERAVDNDFKALFDLGRDSNLPSAAAVDAFERRRFTVREVAALRTDPSLSEDERQQRLASLQSETQAAIRQVLGAEAAERYLQQGGSWVTNVNGL